MEKEDVLAILKYLDSILSDTEKSLSEIQRIKRLIKFVLDNLQG